MSRTNYDHKAQGKGSREQVRPGVWRVRFNLGKNPVTGRYEYSPWRTFHTTSKVELNELAEAYKRELNECKEPASRGLLTLADCLDTFHSRREGTVALSTYQREETILAKTKGLVGSVGLRQADAAFLNERFAWARAQHAMSEADLLRVHTLLNGALKSARKEGLLRENPMELVDRPRPRYQRRAALTAPEARRLREELLARPLEAKTVATLLMLETGCRRGEALGLTWDRVFLDDEAPYVVIDRQLTKEGELKRPKSETGNRTVSVGADLAEILRRWRGEQAEELAAKGVAQGGDTFVAHSLRAEADAGEGGDGRRRLVAGHQDAHNYNRWFKNFCADHGFGDYTEDVTERVHAGRTIRRGKGYVGLTPHGLRHTQATLLIGSGVDVKTVQARLGHSDPSLTLRQYSHALRDNDVRAAAVFDAALRG